MNSVILIKLLICSISLCYSQEVENKTEEITDSVIMRQRRGKVHNHNKLNNDSLKLRVDLNNLGHRIPKQRPIILQKPITNLRVRPRPILNNRINVINSHPTPSTCQQKKTPNPPKVNEETKAVTPVTVNDTKVVKISKKPVFFTEHDTDDDFYEESIPVGPQSSALNRPKDTVQTKAKENCAEDKKDNNDVIIGIMKELPVIIKTVMNERLKSEGNPIVIKNITEITLPIRRGNDIDTGSLDCNVSEKDGQTSGKTHSKSDRYNKELVDLLLKPILKNNIDGDNSNEPFETINIKQHDYSEVIEQKRDQTVFMMGENEQTPAPETEIDNPCPPDNSDAYQIKYFTSSCSSPDIQDTAQMQQQKPAPPSYQCVANSDPVYTAPILAPPMGVYNNMLAPSTYNPYAMYMKSPYDFRMPPPQNINPDCTNNNIPPSRMLVSAPYYNRDYSTFNKPMYNTALDNRLNNANEDGLDDKRNTTWKSWTDTEIVIRKNNNNTGASNPTMTLIPNSAWPRTFHGYGNYYPNHFVPMYAAHPYYCYPRTYVTH